MTKEQKCDCGAEERRKRGYSAHCYSFCASKAPQQKHTPISEEESNQRLAEAMGVTAAPPSSNQDLIQEAHALLDRAQLLLLRARDKHEQASSDKTIAPAATTIVAELRELATLKCKNQDDHEFLMEVALLMETWDGLIARQLNVRSDETKAPQAPIAWAPMTEGAHSDWLAGAIGLADACAERRTPKTTAPAPQQRSVWHQVSQFEVPNTPDMLDWPGDPASKIVAVSNGFMVGRARWHYATRTWCNKQGFQWDIVYWSVLPGEEHFPAETTDGWKRLHNAVASWSAHPSCGPTGRIDITALNKILAYNNPFDSSPEEPKPERLYNLGKLIVDTARGTTPEKATAPPCVWIGDCKEPKTCAAAGCCQQITLQENGDERQ